MMSQNNSNETIAIQKARGIIEKINAVEEFDPISGRNIGISIAGTEFSCRCIYEIRI